ncbi:hypothetical protein HN836_00225, partial [Candidatus Woesearchaeota archaeon]|nr:hypothetical protein [Candidatus Woesearchaeota archaeon]
NQNLSKRKDLNSAQLELLNKYSKTINSFLSENYETFSQKSLSLLSNYDFNTLEFKQFNDIQYNTVDLMYKKSIGAYNDTIDKLSQSPFESKIFNQVIGLSNSMFGFFNKLDKKYGVTDNFKFIINKIETYVNDQNKKRKEKIQLEFIDEKAQYNGGDLKYKFHIDRDSIFQKMF